MKTEETEMAIETRKAAIVKKWRQAEKERLSILAKQRTENRRQMKDTNADIIEDRFCCEVGLENARTR